MARRLVYTPKAYAYTKNAKGEIFDLSNYITGGKVERLVDQVSYAEIKLRNPEKVFTQPGSAAFHPMDPIVIYLERLQGHPVKVFTGFLDTTPYYQMYPGEVTLYASCTLKRLQYIFFDPALPYFTSFLVQFGWYIKEDGTAVSTEASKGRLRSPMNEEEAAQNKKEEEEENKEEEESEEERIKNLRKGNKEEKTEAQERSKVYYKNQAAIEKAEKETYFQTGANSKELAEAAKSKKSLDDSSLGKLLWGLLYYVGQLQNEHIYIEALPPAVASNVTILLKNLNYGAEKARNEIKEQQDYKQFVKEIIGEGGHGTAGTAGGEAEASGNTSASQLKSVGIMVEIAEKYHLPPVFVIAVAVGESSFGTDMGPILDKDGRYSEGWFMWNSNKEPTFSPYRGQGGHSYPSKDAFDTSISTDAFCKAAVWQLAKNPSYKNENNWDAWATVVQNAVGYNISEDAATARKMIKEWEKSKGELHERGSTRGEAEQGRRKKTKAEEKKEEPSSLHERGTTRTEAEKGVHEEKTASEEKYHNPFEKVKCNVHVGRVDSGQDYLVGPEVAKEPIVALGDGEFVGDQGSWGGGDLLVFTLTNGPAKGHAYYYSEGLEPSIPKGKKVKGGEVVAHTNKQPAPGLEFGWYSLKDNIPIGWASWSGSGEKTPSAAGYMWARLMSDLGVKPESPLPNGPRYPGGPEEGGEEESGAEYLVDAKAAAFTSAINLPTAEERALAIILTGQKGLMNDVPLLPFIQQVSKASLRSFMSLPGGEFYAFYPDYFGEFGHHEPYWLIEDIEIINGGISLSDKYLVTHAYVVGDNCLDINTQIPTPNGWATMGELKVGDEIFGSNGKIAKILKVSPTFKDRECFRVCFEDGTSIISDGGHLWETQTYKRKPKIYNTKEIAESLKTNGRHNHRVKVTKPLDIVEQKLAIDPYILGYWLGDGECGQMRITCGSEDQDHLIKQIENIKYEFTERETNASTSGFSNNPYWRTTIYKQRDNLRQLGILNDKHIPSSYLRGSFGQRLALLQGLMDSDGSISKYCCFCVANRKLAADVLELVRSLGFRPGWSEKPERGSSRPQYAVSFAVQSGMNAFRLPRKANRYLSRLDQRSTLTSNFRTIVAVEPVSSVPVKCISVDTEDHLYLAGEGMIPTHNTWPATSNTKLLYINSAGIVTVFNAFNGGIVEHGNKGESDERSHSELENNGIPTALNSTEEAHKFLARYGARPWLDQVPAIRSPMFEMLLAYQNFCLAWSRQFVTPFEFTFMPELFPGGKVGFPNHGLVMYIESVTHEWDLNTGFDTYAKLAAPSKARGSWVKNSTDLPNNMVAELAFPIKKIEGKK